MSKKTTWADVVKGSTVELGGREYRVVKFKPKKDDKRARVVVEHRGRYHDSVVKLKDRVKIIPPAPLHDVAGAQTRWATKPEHDAALSTEGATLGRGDAVQTAPPSDPTGGLWDTPATKAEKKLDALLGARLVGEATDESAGYYVPPVDVSTVAGHLAIFHGGIPAACEDEAAMLRAHEAQHAGALKGESPLAVNHWHTEKRP